jgi:hypothetical protein
VLALYSHYFSFFVLLAHGLYLLVVPARRARFWHWLAAWAVAAILYLPWFAATLAKGYWQLDRSEAPRLARFLTAAGQELAAGPAFDNSLSVWLFLLATLVAVLGWRRLWQKRPGQAAKLGGWIAITTLGIFLVILRRPTFNPFYVAIVAPAWWMLVSLGLVGLWRRRGTGGQWLASVGVVALLGVSVLGLGRYYSDPLTYGRSTGLRPLAAHIKDQWQPNDIIVTDVSEQSIAYYLRDITPGPRIIETQSWPADQQGIESTISRLSNENGRIWFIDNINGATSAEQATFQWLDYHTLLEQRLSFGEQVVFAFRPLHTIAGVIKPVGAGLRDSLVLAGYYATLNGVPLEAKEMISFQPGDELGVTLIWDCIRPITENYTVFVHILAEDGSLIAQHDGTPLFGTRPTTTWEPGERLLDRHVIEIPEGAGGMNGRLVAGM